MLRIKATTTSTTTQPNIAMSLPTSVVRPFGQMDVQRPASILPAPVSPPSTPSSGDRKRKNVFALGDYDRNVCPNAPLRPNSVMHPRVDAMEW